ncbi:MAG: DUF2683 family protein [Candidatus Aenigmarchaeota archaeon]|nr:DUF2683 family protein [Candidatus Aenigmarchaeota archaeon]
MVQAVVKLSEHTNRILNIVKAKYGLRDKSEAIEVNSGKSRIFLTFLVVSFVRTGGKRSLPERHQASCQEEQNTRRRAEKIYRTDPCKS